MSDDTKDLQQLRQQRDRLTARIERLEAEQSKEEERKQARRREVVGLAFEELLTARGERERRRDVALWYLLTKAAPALKRSELNRELALWVEDREEREKLMRLAVEDGPPSEERLEELALCRRAGVKPSPSREEALTDHYRSEDAAHGALTAFEAEGGVPSPRNASQSEQSED